MSVKQISDKEILSMYLNYERVEKGLSLNTLESYGRDLAIYLDFLSRNKKSVLKVSRSDIEKFLDEKNLNDKDEQLYYLIRKTAEDIKELFDTKKLFFKKSHFNEYEREKFYDDLISYCGKDSLKQFFKETCVYNSGDVMLNFETYVANRMSAQGIEELIENYWDTAIGKDCDATTEEYDDFIDTQSGGDLIEKVNAANTFRRFVALPNAVAYLAKICYDEDYAREELEYHKVESYTDEEQRDAEAHGEYDDIRSTDLDKPKKKGKKQ